MTLRQAFGIYQGAMSFKQLQDLRFSPPELIDAGFIEPMDSKKLFWRLTAAGTATNPEAKVADVEVRTVTERESGTGGTR